MAGIGDVVQRYISAETLEAKTEQWMRQIAAWAGHVVTCAEVVDCTGSP
jgi:hypothetical protein